MFQHLTTNSDAKTVRVSSPSHLGLARRALICRRAGAPPASGVTMVLRAFVLLVGVTIAGGVKLGEPAFNGASDENVERAALAEQGASRLPLPPVSTWAHTHLPSQRATTTDG